MKIQDQAQLDVLKRLDECASAAFEFSADRREKGMCSTVTIS